MVAAVAVDAIGSVPAAKARYWNEPLLASGPSPRPVCFARFGRAGPLARDRCLCHATVVALQEVEMTLSALLAVQSRRGHRVRCFAFLQSAELGSHSHFLSHFRFHWPGVVSYLLLEVDVRLKSPLHEACARNRFRSCEARVYEGPEPTHRTSSLPISSRCADSKIQIPYTPSTREQQRGCQSSHSSAALQRALNARRSI